MDKKSELRKMLDGELYEAWDEELISMRDKARQLKYNAMMGDLLKKGIRFLGNCWEVAPPLTFSLRSSATTGLTFSRGRTSS